MIVAVAKGQSKASTDLWSIIIVPGLEGLPNKRDVDASCDIRVAMTFLKIKKVN